MELFDRIVDRDLLVRRINIATNHVVDAESYNKETHYEQMDLFSYMDESAKDQQKESESEREKKMQQAMLTIKKKYGKNAILKGMNLQEGAMTVERNKQIGGHKE